MTHHTALAKNAIENFKRDRLYGRNPEGSWQLVRWLETLIQDIEKESE